MLEPVLKRRKKSSKLKKTLWQNMKLLEKIPAFLYYCFFRINNFTFAVSLFCSVFICIEVEKTWCAHSSPLKENMCSLIVDSFPSSSIDETGLKHIHLSFNYILAFLVLITTGSLVKNFNKKEAGMIKINYKTIVIRIFLFLLIPSMYQLSRLGDYVMNY